MSVITTVVDIFSEKIEASKGRLVIISSATVEVELGSPLELADYNDTLKALEDKFSVEGYSVQRTPLAEDSDALFVTKINRGDN